MIAFRCQHCGQKLKTGDDRAGRVSRCPHCKRDITVPQLRVPNPPAAQGPEELAPIKPATPLDGDLLDLPDRRQERELLDSLGIQPAPESTGRRRFPWPLDILLYPCNAPGLTALVIIVGVPLVLRLVHVSFFVIDILIGIYAGWYFAECVYDSARGDTRAPQAFVAGVGLGEMWSRVLYLAGPYILFAGPAGFYYLYLQKTDTVFWLLAGWAVVFFPMGLLAMVMHDSSWALNPLFLLGSIRRTFFQYAGLMLLFGTAVVLRFVPGSSGPEPRPMWLDIVGSIASGYAAFVTAHILGRFYWRNSERLDWGI